MSNLDKLIQLPRPYDKPGMEQSIIAVKESWKNDYCTSLDGFIGNDRLLRPKTNGEERKLIKKFLSGLDKLFSEETNRSYLQPLELSYECCVKCDICSQACHVFIGSGGEEVYRPLFRSEILRKLRNKYRRGGSLLNRYTKGNIEINVEAIMRLGELAYRCNLCRRCAQVCPLGLDNGLLAREIRKLFSMEMNMAPSYLHEKGTALQLKTGSSTGMNRNAFLDIIEFIEEDIHERTSKQYKIPVDKKGADILLIHNAGEYISWPDNPAAYVAIFEEAGLDWTLSSDLAGYDVVNYGLFYDDIQAQKIVSAQIKVAKKLGVKRIVVGECGHAHRASVVIADRFVVGEKNIPRESCFPILWELIKKKAIKLDPSRNNFPVTLHDPCNIVRMMGIVQPQRKIIKAICPQFREMTPCGVENYCCGGGSGFVVMKSLNFPEWVSKVGGRMKFKQILQSFQDVIDATGVPKYVCAPCSNCKGAIRGILEYYDATCRFNFQYGGLAELIVNAMIVFDKPYIEFLGQESF